MEWRSKTEGIFLEASERRGDNGGQYSQQSGWKDQTVPEEAVLGVLTGFVRNGQQYKVTDGRYLRYVHFWNAVYPVRSLYVRSKWKARSIVKRIIRPDVSK